MPDLSREMLDFRDAVVAQSLGTAPEPLGHLPAPNQTTIGETRMWSGNPVRAVAECPGWVFVLPAPPSPAGRPFSIPYATWVGLTMLQTAPEPLSEALMISGHRGLLDGEEGGYGVAFVELPGCVAMGATREEALANAKEALEDWLSTVRARSPMPPRYSTGMTLAAYASGFEAAQDAEARPPEGLEGDAAAAWRHGREAGRPGR